MLIFIIGFLIAGIVHVVRGNGLIQKALQCDDEEEKAALEALGKKNLTIGKILIFTSIAFTVALIIPLIFLGIS